MQTSIYMLVDPRGSQCRYIGKAIDPKKRLHQHRCHPSSLRLKRWLDELTALKLRPRVEAIRRYQGEEWRQGEDFWIKKFRELGADLFNIAPGGIGPSDHHFTKEIREARSRATKAYLARPGVREALKKNMQRITSDPEVRERMSLSQQDRWRRPNAAHPKRKSVTKYSLAGVKVAEFRSLTAAAAAMNLSKAAIGKAIRENQSVQGFRWAFGDNPITKGFRESRGQDRAHSRAVRKYSLDGVIVAEFQSVFHASKQIGVAPSVIRYALRGKCTSGGFRWGYADTPLADAFRSRLGCGKSQQKRVRKADLEKKSIKEFESLAAAAKEAATSPSNLLTRMKLGKPCKGFIYSYY